MAARYLVLIVVQNKWFSDQQGFPTVAAARRHRRSVARRWSNCDTAIGCGERVMFFEESLRSQAELARLLEAA